MSLLRWLKRQNPHENRTAYGRENPHENKSPYERMIDELTRNGYSVDIQTKGTILGRPEAGSIAVSYMLSAPQSKSATETTAADIVADKPTDVLLINNDTGDVTKLRYHE